MSSTSAPQKCEWIVILPDQAGALGRRLEVRPKHIDNIKSKHSSGFYPFGGAYFSEPPVEGETPKILGSVMLAYAASKEEVIADLKEDLYSKNEVWDWEKVQIYPFKSAIRSAL